MEKLALKSRACLGSTWYVIAIIANAAREVLLVCQPISKTIRLCAILANQAYGRGKTLDLVIRRDIFAATVELLCIGEQQKYMAPVSPVVVSLMTHYRNQQGALHRETMFTIG